MDSWILGFPRAVFFKYLIRPPPRPWSKGFSGLPTAERQAWPLKRDLNWPRVGGGPIYDLGLDWPSRPVPRDEARAETVRPTT